MHSSTSAPIADLAPYRRAADWLATRERPVSAHGVSRGPDVADVLDRMRSDPLFSAALRAAFDSDIAPSSATVPLLGSRPLAVAASLDSAQCADPNAERPGLPSPDEVIAACPVSGCLALATLTLRDCTDPATMRDAVADALTDAHGVTSAWIGIGAAGREHVHAHGLVQLVAHSALRRLVSSWGGEHAARAVVVTGWPGWVSGREGARAVLVENLGRILAYLARHSFAASVGHGPLRRVFPSRVGGMGDTREQLCTVCRRGVDRGRALRGWTTCTPRCSATLRQRRCSLRRRSRGMAPAHDGRDAR